MNMQSYNSTILNGKYPFVTISNGLLLLSKSRKLLMGAMKMAAM